MVGIDLSGKVAVTTGGGRGLGAATTERLHAAGANVVVTYFSDPDGANLGLATALGARLGERALVIEADVRDPAGLDHMVTRILDHWGRLDIVVNNAAILSDRTLKKMDHEAWDRVLETNLTGVYNVCRAVVEHLADDGRIVNMASVSAVLGFFGQANYAAAKAGVMGLTRVLSRELARRRITVNAVAPGVALTDMGQSIPEEVRAKMLEQIPLDRFAEPREVADVVLFLCSDLASYVTGQTIHVNGGWWG